MEFINIQNDYTWVVKVLESCLTLPKKYLNSFLRSGKMSYLMKDEKN